MTGLRRYGEVLRPAGTRPALVASLAGRVALAMNGLALLLLVKEATGSYASAGAVSACYSVALAVAQPMRARAADRRGPMPVLLLCGVLHPLSLVVIVLLTRLDAPVLVDALAALVIGATVPPIGSVMRALWGELVPPALLPFAYSLDAVLVEVCFVVGPLTVALVAGAFSPGAAVVVSAVYGCLGGLGLAGVGVVRATRPVAARPTHVLGPLVSPVVRASLLIVFCVGVSFGAIEVGVLAFVEEHGFARSVGGAVLAVWAGGSALGGLAYASVHVSASAARQLPVLAGLAGAAASLPLLAPNVALLAVLVLLAGATIAPWNGVNSVVVGQAAPAGTTTEAFAWFSTLIFTGASLGTAISGVLADAHGATGVFLVASVAGALGVLSAGLAVRVLKVHGGDASRVAL